MTNESQKPDTVLFCKDCQFSRPATDHRGDAKLRFAKCSARASFRDDKIYTEFLVTAKLNYLEHADYCTSMRQDHGPNDALIGINRCGPEARFFIANTSPLPLLSSGRLTLWQRAVAVAVTLFTRPRNRAAHEHQRNPENAVQQTVHTAGLLGVAER